MMAEASVVVTSTIRRFPSRISHAIQQLPRLLQDKADIDPQQANAFSFLYPSEDLPDTELADQLSNDQIDEQTMMSSRPESNHCREIPAHRPDRKRVGIRERLEFIFKDFFIHKESVSATVGYHLNVID